MFEKVNPSHPDKIADRIAGALVDYAYQLEKDPKIAVEVLIGHGKCHICAETSISIPSDIIDDIVMRIVGTSDIQVNYTIVPQDKFLRTNQAEGFRCGDNGIFRGMPITSEQRNLTNFVKNIYKNYPYDGKYICNENNLIICQSNIERKDAINYTQLTNWNSVKVNPLGYWIGGINVDTGATNRKLGSDMGDSITGGGLHGKDLSKADVSVNIYAWLKAQITGKEVQLYCAIGDDTIDGLPYAEIVENARKYIQKIGGFEKFAEWGLIR